MPYADRENQRANDRARHARQTPEQREAKNRRQREKNAAARAAGVLRPRKKKPVTVTSAPAPAPSAPPQPKVRKREKREGTDPRPILRQTGDYFRFSATERDPRRFWIGPPKEDQAKVAENVQPLLYGIVEKCRVSRKSSRTGQSQPHSYRAYDDLGQPIFNARDGSLYFDTRIDAGWAVYEYAHEVIAVAV